MVFCWKGLSFDVKPKPFVDSDNLLKVKLLEINIESPDKEVNDVALFQFTVSNTSQTF